MMQTEKELLKEIMRLLSDLENATYGEYKTNGVVFTPNASRFYFSAKKLYTCTDELIAQYHPNYVTSSDYNFICASKRVILNNLSVLKEKKLKNNEITWELELILSEIQSLFKCISMYGSD